MMMHLNHRMKVALLDGRTFVGYFKAFDKHMNILLSECEERRKIKSKTARKGEDYEKRSLGLVLLRGEYIISLTVDGPPQKDDDSAKLPKAGGMGGPGAARPAGRGIPMVPSGIPAPPQGLQGSVRGIGGPAMAMMQPNFCTMPPPMNMPRPPG